MRAKRLGFVLQISPLEMGCWDSGNDGGAINQKKFVSYKIVKGVPFNIRFPISGGIGPGM